MSLEKKKIYIAVIAVLAVLLVAEFCFFDIFGIGKAVGGYASKIDSAIDESRASRIIEHPEKYLGKEIRMENVYTKIRAADFDTGSPGGDFIATFDNINQNNDERIRFIYYGKWKCSHIEKVEGKVLLGNFSNVFENREPVTEYYLKGSDMECAGAA